MSNQLISRLLQEAQLISIVSLKALTSFTSLTLKYSMHQHLNVLGQYLPQHINYIYPAELLPKSRQVHRDPSCKRSTEPEATEQFHTVGRQTPAGHKRAVVALAGQNCAGQSAHQWALLGSLLTTEPSSTLRRLMGWAYYARTIPTSFDGCLLDSTVLCCL